MLRDSDKLRRETQMKHQKREDSRVIFHVMNTGGPTHYDSITTGLAKAALPQNPGYTEA